MLDCSQDIIHLSLTYKTRELVSEAEKEREAEKETESFWTLQTIAHYASLL